LIREGSFASSSNPLILFFTIAVRLRVGNMIVTNGLFTCAFLTSTCVAGSVHIVSVLWIDVFFPQWLAAMTVVSAVFTICWLVFCNSHTSNYTLITWSLHF